MTHWITRIVRDAGLTPVAHFEIDASAPIQDVWAATGRAYGIDSARLAGMVAHAFRTRVVDLAPAEPTASRLIPARVVKRLRVFPIRDLDRTIEVATSNPADATAQQEIQFTSGRMPVMVIAPPDDISAAIESAYSPDLAVASLLARVGSELEGIDDIGLQLDEEPEPVTEAEISGPVVRLTNLILAQAVARGASDIHIQPVSGGGVVRFRQDGVLRSGLQMPMSVLTRVVSRIKIIGELDITDRLRPQDGRARIVVAGRPYDLRVSTVPTRHAEKAVIRILDTQASKTLSDSGIQSSDLQRIRAALAQRDGIFVVAGPTGSGKTTTLYGALREIATEDVNIMTVEDPVEYEISGLTQIQVDPKQGVTFASALRAMLRQDPDVIFVGEIRDAETAEIAVQASLTGHLVLATLHANDAVGCIRRFLDLGLDRGTIAEVLRGALAQRLLRRVCPHCVERVDGDLSVEEAAAAARVGVAQVVRSPGCDRCLGTGYLGRLPVTEFLAPTEQLVSLVLGEASPHQIHAQAEKDGMSTLLGSARERVRAGETTPREVERVVGTAAGVSGEPTPETPAVSHPPPALRDEDDVPHVLVVDDDGTTRSIARTILENEGYRVSEADDGSAALAYIGRGDDFSLMVLDLDMPLLGGREVLRAVRRSLTTAGLPIIVLTGTSDPDADVQVFEDGADDYIRKPIDPKRFLLRVNAALRRAQG